MDKISHNDLLEDRKIILEEWKTCVEMADSISHRRDTMNNWFLTVNIALVTLVFSQIEIQRVALIICGILFDLVWVLLIRNYKLLNREKFVVIRDLEKKLPYQPLDKEWELLGKEKRYLDTTSFECFLPCLFILGYFICLVLIFSGGLS